jgi:GNAT superfamily N-acetyltransferase
MPSVRLATPADAALLATVARRTFFDAYSGADSSTDLQIHMDRHFGELQQAAELADPATATLLLEDDDGSAIGYALLGDDAAPPCVTGAAALQIRRFYVDQVWTGKGVAQQLMAAVDVEARRRGRQTIWLLAWFKNHRAHAFYRKCGFVEVGTAPYLFGNTVEQDLAMARPIAP